jgi:hypothetical protein
MSSLTKIQKLYEKIPKSNCKKGCMKCCNDMIQVAREEDERMGGYRWDGKCAHLNDDRCGVYENRAFICRLFGTSETMRCPDCTPETFLTKSETQDLVNEYVRLKGLE